MERVMRDERLTCALCTGSKDTGTVACDLRSLQATPRHDALLKCLVSKVVTDI